MPENFWLGTQSNISSIGVRALTTEYTNSMDSCLGRSGRGFEDVSDGADEAAIRRLSVSGFTFLDVAGGVCSGELYACDNNDPRVDGSCSHATSGCDDEAIDMDSFGGSGTGVSTDGRAVGVVEDNPHRNCACSTNVSFVAPATLLSQTASALPAKTCGGVGFMLSVIGACGAARF
jgi:hypothetical protein